MARMQPPVSSVHPPARPRLRSKEYMFALIAGIFVLACYFYTREGSGLQPSTAPATTPETLEIPISTDDVVIVDPSPISSKVSGVDSPSSGDTYSTSFGGGSSSSSSSSNTGLGEHGGSGGSSGAGSASSTLASTGLSPDSPRAVIIESSMIPNLIPLMLHFATILGPAWGMILFTLQENWVEPLSPAFQRLRDSGHIDIRFLPEDTELTSSQAVSRFLTSPWIWEQVEQARRILLFQSDSVLCARAEAAADDYFGYDFVGAPISSVYGEGYNGGLSIRNPRAFLQVVRETDFATSGQEFEDQFFFTELKKRGAELPDEAVAKTFSVETIYYETPLGYHQPQRWQAANMGKIEEWCPEVKMLIGRRAH